MHYELINSGGDVVQDGETSNIELSDDLGFSVDHLTEANEDLPDEVVEIRVRVP